MRLRSMYESGPDEEEIFMLTHPASHPNTEDKTIAEVDVQSLSALAYDDLQEQRDEQIDKLIERLYTLPPQRIAELNTLIDSLSDSID